MSPPTDSDRTIGDAAPGVTFVAFPGMSDVEIVDPIERHRYTLSAPHELDPVEADPDSFLFPVDDAITVTTSAFELPSIEAVYVRGKDGKLQTEVDHLSSKSMPAGEHIVEVCSPVKIYMEFNSAVKISSNLNSMRITFQRPTEVAIGARSAHEQPAGTVTTTTAPTDVMAAVSTFGSALKSHTPERSFPSLRGHPPLIEVGEELAIPSDLLPPETGITIELRPDHAQIYSAASLTYYLGATMVPGEKARIQTETGFVHDLVSNDGFQREVERVLEQIFLLDCITRTEGLYAVDLQERRDLESRVDLDFSNLYDMSIEDRFVEYLDIPYSTVADLIPDWGLAAHTTPTPEGIELLPYLVDDLAHIRVHRTQELERPERPRDMIEPAAIQSDQFTRSARGTNVGSSGPFVQPPDSGAVEQVWIGDGTPIGASKVIPEAYENRLGRQPATGDIGIKVVCNASNMLEEEGLINDIYGSRHDLGFEITIHRGLDTESLASLLRTETDFLHYIGHIDSEGFECPDGKFDASSLETVGVDAFLLNACESYEQGRHLIEAGSIGGIVTLSDVINSEAVRIGQSLARMLNGGFPLYSALEIARWNNLMGGRYIVVGDGRIALTQPQSVPYFCKIDRVGNQHDFRYVSYPTARIDLGSMTIPYIGENGRHFLVSRRIDALSPSKEEIYEFLQLENAPVRINGSLKFSEDINPF